MNQPIEPLASHPAPPCAVVIFGASGDLTKRKLVPSLYNLASIGMLAPDFSIIGVARRELSHEDFREQMSRDMQEFATQKIDPTLWAKFRERIYYCQGAFDDPGTYQRLATLVQDSEKKHGTQGNALFYLSVQPTYFAPIAEHLKQAGLVDEAGDKWRRVIVEKPFGHDLASARELNGRLGAALKESQIFRIDHYLGKETAQNILVFRVGNAMFEPIWNRHHIDHVQITVAEAIGVEGRGAFYETAGAFRDVIQNHMFMLMALIAMEPPNSLAGEAVRNEKVKLLQAVRQMTPDEVLRDTVRGQYGPGTVNGKPAPGYREEKNVAPDSTIETYAALKLGIDNWRWAGVPFYLRSGKRLPRRSTEIIVRFRNPALSLFGDNESDPLGPNRLIFHIQPEEGISLQVRAKVPGPTIRTRGVKLDFGYSQFGPVAPTTGYEKMMYDCMMGDSTLFHRTDMVDAAWTAAQPIIETWAAHPPTDMPNYPAGTWGPEAADARMQRDAHTWQIPVA